MIPNFTGIVLAGGSSSRFGSNKALAPWRGKPLILHVLEILKPVFSSCLVVARETSDYESLHLDVPVIGDRVSKRHPLVGILSGLEHSKSDCNFICGCDMPLLQSRLVEFLCETVLAPSAELRVPVGEPEAPSVLDFDAVIPVWGGKVQSLCGVYSKRCLGSVRAVMAENGQEVPSAELFRMVRTRFLNEEEVALADPEGLSFLDVDTLDDYQRLDHASTH
ncbi:MAG: molybdenum cofactor guanylyltransferase [Elusimicrobia bacterium]|nr:molybdenum cofactor guanylyltransferase [Elusimicrobiota bacterium]